MIFTLRPFKDHSPGSLKVTSIIIHDLGWQAARGLGPLFLKCRQPDQSEFLGTTGFSDLSFLGYCIGKALLRQRGYTSTNLPCSIIQCEIMALSIGTQLGLHEITGLMGKGGR